EALVSGRRGLVAGGRLEAAIHPVDVAALLPVVAEPALDGAPLGLLGRVEVTELLSQLGVPDEPVFRRRVVRVAGADRLNAGDGAAAEVHQVNVERLILLEGPGGIATGEVHGGRRVGSSPDAKGVRADVSAEDRVLDRPAVPNHQVDLLELPVSDAAVV